MSLLTVVLLSHNRPMFATAAIESILDQSEKKFKFWVSDNSSNKELQEIVKDRFPEIEYKSWFPGVSVGEHFKKVLSSISTPYFVMFHDDDLMEPDFARKILEAFKEEPLAAAIGAGLPITEPQSFA